MKYVLILILPLASSMASLTVGAQCRYIKKERTTEIGKSGYPEIDRIKLHLDSIAIKIQRYLGIVFTIRTYDDGKDRNAFATKKNEIILGTGLMNDCLRQDTGFLCLDFVLFHEISHLFQYKDSSNHLSTKPILRDFELQADCLASKMVYDVMKLRDTKKFQNILNFIFTMGDYSFDNYEHHGTPMERYIAAFVYWNIYSKNVPELYEKSKYLFDDKVICHECTTICHLSIKLNEDLNKFERYCIGLDMNMYRWQEDDYGIPSRIQGRVIPTAMSTMETFIFEKYYDIVNGKGNYKRFYVKMKIIYSDETYQKVVGEIE